MSQWILTVLVSMLSVGLSARAAQSGITAPKGSKVFFVDLKNGATVKKTFKVKFGVQGIKIRKAGEDAEDRLTGHHHLIVDGKPLPAGVPVPADATNLHYGKGQTEAEITLAPGTHTLTLQFADGAHRSYGEQLSSTITVTVR